MKRLLLLGAALLATQIAVRADETAGLTLRIAPVKTTWKIKNTRYLPEVRITLSNEGREPVSLLTEGDGSDVGWRTPLVSWKMFPLRSGAKELRRQPLVRCGNMNPLSERDLFTLAPGQSRTWTDCVELRTWKIARPGRYRLVFFFRNDPTLGGRQVSKEMPELMEQVRSSTPCSLKSNEIVLNLVR